MRTPRRTMRGPALVCAIAAGLTLAACGGAPDEPVTPHAATPNGPVTAPQAADAAASAAIAAYTAYWEVTDAARAAPSARDWRPEIESVARGQALETALLDVENYASIPAHTVGEISRSPSVAGAEPTRVSILDCVDLGDAGLVSDRTGARLDDLANRVQRFRLRAEVVVEADGRWVVEQTTPALDEPC